jgi:imidazole glycerol-phosphate synthase subunit HisF
VTNVRIIPRLDVKNNTIVKGIHLEGLRIVGNPQESALKYYENGADELLYMDAVASLYERNSLHDIISKTAENVFIPITVGGGLRSIDDIRKVLRSGADKVAINTAAIKNPEFISEAANTFGSQCIVVSIEAKNIAHDKWEAFIDTGRESTGINAIDWANKCVDLGAGELLITSIDSEGTKKGFEINLIKKISNKVPIPVIACGGAGEKSHFIDLLKSTNIEAISCASILHYDILTISQIKHELHKNSISVRLD